MSGQDLCPGRGLRGKERLHGQRSSPGSEWFQPDTGHTSPGVLHREDEPHRLVGQLVGLTEGLWEAWTPLFRNTCTLAPESVRRRRTESCISGWPVSQDCPPPAPGSCSSLSLGNTPALLASKCSCTFTFSTLFSLVFLLLGSL